MSRALKITDQTGLYFVTFTVVHWIDLFTRLAYKNLLLKSLRHCQEKKGLRVHAFVIMTSHLHLVLSAEKESAGLSAIIRDFKKYNSSELDRAIKA